MAWQWAVFKDMWRGLISGKRLTLAERGRNGHFKNKLWWWWWWKNYQKLDGCKTWHLHGWSTNLSVHQLISVQMMINCFLLIQWSTDPCSYDDQLIFVHPMINWSIYVQFIQPITSASATKALSVSLRMILILPRKFDWSLSSVESSKTDTREFFSLLLFLKE